MTSKLPWHNVAALEIFLDSIGLCGKNIPLFRELSLCAPLCSAVEQFRLNLPLNFEV